MQLVASTRSGATPRSAKHVAGDARLSTGQREENVFGPDMVVPESLRLRAGAVEYLVGCGTPAPGPSAGLGRRGPVALLDGLLAGAEQLADLRPRKSGLARLGDEAPDQHVAQIGELATESDRHPESRRGRLLGGACFDRGDELVDLGGTARGHSSRLS